MKCALVFSVIKYFWRVSVEGLISKVNGGLDYSTVKPANRELAHTVEPVNSNPVK
jgi:hypothetical protein